MSDRLTPEREAEIAARAEAATEGPWEEYEGYGPHFYAYLRGPYMRGIGTLNFGEGEDAEADKALTLNAREDIRDLLAELAAVRAELDDVEAEREKLVRWHIEDSKSLAKALAHVAELKENLRAVKAGWDVARARIAELERPAVEAKRNEVRSSFGSTIAQAQEDRDHEGAFALECQLREREEQWKREDEAVSR